MFATPKNTFTPDEYLALETVSDYKNEYVDGHIYAMAGASPAHGYIQMTLAHLLYEGVRKKKCRIMGSDTRVYIPPMRYFYPDMVIVCGDPNYNDTKPPSLLNPSLIIEILSPSTKDYDRDLKFAMYKALDSLMEYVVVHQDTARIENWLRHDANRWLHTDAIGEDSNMTFQTIATTLRVGDVYEQLKNA
jgi:Uma2 family endonuclease